MTARRVKRTKYRPAHPDLVAASYRRKLIPFLHDMQRLYTLRIRALTIRSDAAGDVPKELKDALDAAHETLSDLWSDDALKSLVQPIFQATEKFNAANQPSKLKALKLPKEKAAALQADFVDANVSLIQSIEERFHDGLAEYLAKQVAAGDRWDDISETISDRYDVSESQADCIARDQVSKANADLSRERQVDAGVTEFIWRSVGDERVRPEHQELDGNTFSWSEGAPGDDQYPGRAVLCRCYADPIIGL